METKRGKHMPIIEYFVARILFRILLRIAKRDSERAEAYNANRDVTGWDIQIQIALNARAGRSVARLNDFATYC